MHFSIGTSYKNRNPNGIFIEIKKCVIHMESQKTVNSQINLEQEEQAGSITLLVSKYITKL